MTESVKTILERAGLIDAEIEAIRQIVREELYLHRGGTVHQTTLAPLAATTASFLAVPHHNFPKASPVRIILHWTAGWYRPSEEDREHYHFLITGPEPKPSDIEAGVFGIEANDSTYDADGYAAHISRWNTKSIGVALCGMVGARSCLEVGKNPVTPTQFHLAADLCADLCHFYNINPMKAVLSHFEAPDFGGSAQSGKWDVSCVPGLPHSGKKLMNYFRELVATGVERLG